MSQNDITLPTGSDRNKIEALAEQIRQAGEAIKTLAESGAKIEGLQQAVASLSGITAPENLLRNATFTETFPTMLNFSTESRIADLAQKFSVVNAVGKPIAPSWSVEFESGKMAKFLSASGGNYSAGKFDAGTPKIGGSVLFGGEGRAVLFQEFEKPLLQPMGENKYHAYLRCCQTSGGQKVRFGVAYLDYLGNASAIIASKEIVLPDGLYDVKEFWLEIPPSFNQGAIDPQTMKRLAYFVETPANAILAVEATGFYYGKSDQVPSLSNARTGIGFEFRVPKKLSKESPNFAITAPIGTYAPEKHLAFLIYENDAGNWHFASRDVSFQMNDDGVINMANFSQYNLPASAQVKGFNCPNLYTNIFSLLAPLA